MIFRFNYDFKTSKLKLDLVHLESWPRSKKLKKMALKPAGRRIGPWSNQIFRLFRSGSTYRKFTVFTETSTISSWFKNILMCEPFISHPLLISSPVLPLTSLSRFGTRTLVVCWEFPLAILILFTQWLSTRITCLPVVLSTIPSSFGAHDFKIYFLGQFIN